MRRGDALIANSEASFRQARRGSVVLVIFPRLLGAVLFYFGLGERGGFDAPTAMGAILAVFAIVVGGGNGACGGNCNNPVGMSAPPVHSE